MSKKIRFLVSKVMSAFGVVILTYIVSLNFHFTDSSVFFKSYILLGFVSILSTFGLSTLILIDRKLKINPVRHYRYNLYIIGLLFCVTFFGFFVALLGKLNIIRIDWIILSFPFQTLCLLLSSLLKVRGLISFGSITEQGSISLLTALVLYFFEVNSINNVMLIYLFSSIVIVALQLIVSFKLGTFMLPRNTKYFLCFPLLLKRSYHLFLSSIYTYLNTWVVTFVLSVNEKFFVLYNLVVRTSSVFNFVINAINNYFMVESRGMSRKDEFYRGIEKIERQVIFQRPILYFIAVFIVVFVIFNSAINDFVSFDFLLLFICMQSVFSYLIVGPTGALCISLGYLKYSHDINFTILLIQLLFSIIYYFNDVYSYLGLVSLVFICQFLIASKDWVYKLCLKKIEKQLS